MAVSRSPIFHSQVKCPVCDSVNAHANIRPGAYRYTGQDTDYCPTGLVWSGSVPRQVDAG
jgi:hypothetical protein